MSYSTIDCWYWHNAYSDDGPRTQYLVDEAFAAARAVLVSYGVKPLNNDAAEDVVAAIYKYVYESETHEQELARIQAASQ